MGIGEYAEALRERLPDYEVRHASTAAEERELVADAPIVTGGSISDELLDRADDMRLFACSSAGINHLPLGELEDSGVTVTNASGVHGPNMAEHVIGSMLLFTRSLDEGIRRDDRREWRHYRSFGELTDSTVTVVGLGAIGEAIVERLSGFGVHTIGVRYTPSKGGPTDEVIGFETEPFHEALARTDYLVVACPLTDTTEGLIGEAEFATLPTDAIVVNVARGAVIETEALVAAVRGNGIEAAALDVTDPEPLPEDHPLYSFENVLVTPHVSGHTEEYWTRLADILARNVERIEETGSFDGLENQVVGGGS
jgi:phosphoglycerate dehydrogenase-like enzyme